MGPRQEACAFSIVVFVLPRLLEALSVLCLSLYPDSDASADACMTSSLCIRALEAPGL